MALPLLSLAQASGGGGLFDLMLPMVMVFGIFYFLVIRPQGKQRKERETMLSLLKRDDDVITVGGILGKIRSINEGVVTLEIADRVQIRVRLVSIEGKANAAATTTASEGSLPSAGASE
jgi:preprotein translocase subunit YajC